MIGGFITERCRTGDECKVSATAILKAVQLWAKDNGLRSVRRNEFIDYMKKRGFRKDRLTASNDKGKIYWFGLELKPDELDEKNGFSGGGDTGEYNGDSMDKRPF